MAEDRKNSSPSHETLLLQHTRVGRFFNRVFSEALQLPADLIRLKFGEKTATATLCRNELDLKSTEFKADWFPMMASWLYERFCMDNRRSGTNPDFRSGFLEFSSATKTNDQMLRFRVVIERSEIDDSMRILISDFTPVSWDAAAKACGYNEECQASLEGLLAAKKRAACRLGDRFPAALLRHRQSVGTLWAQSGSRDQGGDG